MIPPRRPVKIVKQWGHPGLASDLFPRNTNIFWAMITVNI